MMRNLKNKDSLHSAFYFSRMAAKFFSFRLGLVCRREQKSSPLSLIPKPWKKSRQLAYYLFYLLWLANLKMLNAVSHHENPGKRSFLINCFSNVSSWLTASRLDRSFTNSLNGHGGDNFCKKISGWIFHDYWFLKVQILYLSSETVPKQFFVYNFFKPVSWLSNITNRR